MTAPGTERGRGTGSEAATADILAEARRVRRSYTVVSFTVPSIHELQQVLAGTDTSDVRDHGDRTG